MEGREGKGTWNGDMEGKDMPAGQPCDVFATCQNMCAYVFCRRGGKKLSAHLGILKWVF